MWDSFVFSFNNSRIALKTLKKGVDKVEKGCIHSVGTLRGCSPIRMANTLWMIIFFLMYSNHGSPESVFQEGGILVGAGLVLGF
jgi:hypothetical protein